MWGWTTPGQTVIVDFDHTSVRVSSSALLIGVRASAVSRHDPQWFALSVHMHVVVPYVLVLDNWLLVLFHCNSVTIAECLKLHVQYYYWWLL